MNPVQTCPNCTDKPARPVFSIERGNRVVLCTGCGLQFAEVYPDLATADREVYGTAYFDDAIEKGGERVAVFNELLAEIEHALGRRGRLLDVGAGEGGLLAVAGKRGWRAEGTEISTAMVERARRGDGPTLHAGVLEDLDLERGAYDVIIMNHVLEHVKNPCTTLEKAGALLRADGLVRLEVPNIASLSSRGKNLQSRFGLKPHRWKHYDTGHHFWFFTTRTLRTTIETAGLDVVTITTPRRQWGRAGRPEGPIDRFYKRASLGKHIVAYARRAG